jgi:hypothetical protein
MARTWEYKTVALTHGTMGVRGRAQPGLGIRETNAKPR